VKKAYLFVRIFQNSDIKNVVRHIYQINSKKYIKKVEETETVESTPMIIVTIDCTEEDVLADKIALEIIKIRRVYSVDKILIKRNIRKPKS